jgi:hypothetical protein
MDSLSPMISKIYLILSVVLGPGHHCLPPPLVDMGRGLGLCPAIEGARGPHDVAEWRGIREASMESMHHAPMSDCIYLVLMVMADPHHQCLPTLQVTTSRGGAH